jgi:hypothetical protein
MLGGRPIEAKYDAIRRRYSSDFRVDCSGVSNVRDVEFDSCRAR